MTQQRTDRTASLRRAIAIMGSAAGLARALGIKPQALSQWRTVPVKRCRDVARLTGVPLLDLRPDLFGEPDPTTAPVPTPATGGARC